MGFKLGDRLNVTVTITDKMVRQFAELSGDHNPIHLDEEYAKTTRFGRRIAHGMISGAIISRALGAELGPGGIYLAQTMKFMSPVFIDDVLTVELYVASFREERGIGIIETNIKNQRGELVVKGEATIMTKDAVKK
jgi:3-hydroxybutyryl-CoA dehydratase